MLLESTMIIPFVPWPIIISSYVLPKLIAIQFFAILIISSQNHDRVVEMLAILFNNCKSYYNAFVHTECGSSLLSSTRKLYGGYNLVSDREKNVSYLNFEVLVDFIWLLQEDNWRLASDSFLGQKCWVSINFFHLYIIVSMIS